jgi:exosortase A
MNLALPLRMSLGASAWRTHLVALGLVAATILALFARDAAAMASIWWNSSTFNHVLLIPPIIAWLVWQRLPELRALSPAAWSGGLALLALGAASWLVGDAGGIATGRHLGLVLMLQGAVIACLGPSVARGLTFPIFFALFLVPFGEELVPALQAVTADIAMALLGLSGIPAHIEGIFITTPAGYFEVAEACAGAKFLIAMVAFGALVANVCFRSWPRRIAFLAASVVVPILANGIRAWGTIFIASRTSVDFAEGFDHVIYGGIFFAIVIALMIGAAWPFFDRGIDDSWLGRTGPARRGAPIGFAAAAAVTIAALPLAWAAAIAASGAQSVPVDFALPEVRGWQRVPARGLPWRPGFANADLVRSARYRDGRGREVDLVVAAYARQFEGHELVGFGQGNAPGWAWAANAAAPLGGRAERIGSHGLVREVATFYRVGAVMTGSGVGVKLETMKARLIGGPQQAVAVLVSAPAPAAGISPRPAIDDFLRALGPVETLADRAAGRN